MAGSEYPVSVRLRKWDAADSVWHDVLYLPEDAITGVDCAFLGHRIEDRASVTAVDRGRITSEPETQTLLDDINRDVGAVYRLDIHAPDTRIPTDTREWDATAARAGMIYWSGRVIAIDMDEAAESRGIRIKAVGWSHYLSKVVLEDRAYINTLLRRIVADVAAATAAAWPGPLGFQRTTRGTLDNLRVDELYLKATTAADLLSSVARFGNFTFGVSVSGAGGGPTYLDDVDDDLTAWSRSANATVATSSVSDPPLGFDIAETTYLLTTGSSSAATGLYSLGSGNFEKEGLQQKLRLYVRVPEASDLSSPTGNAATGYFSLWISEDAAIPARVGFQWVSGVPTVVSNPTSVATDVLRIDDDWYRVEVAFTSTAAEADTSRTVTIEVSSLSESTDVQSLTVYRPDLVDDAEFTLVFFEAAFDSDSPAATTGDMRSRVGLVVDANSPTTFELSIEDEGGEYANAWSFAGEQSHVDLMSTISETTSRTISDWWHKSTAARDSGVGTWESTLKGARLQILDLARREQYVDAVTGERYHAGGLAPLPTKFRRASVQESEFLVDDFEEETGSISPTTERATYTLNSYPGLNVSSELEARSYRYTLHPGGLVVYRTIENTDETADRETVTTLTVDGSVRGTLQAGIFAGQAQFAQEANRRSVKLGVMNQRTLPNGRQDRQNNLVQLAMDDTNHRLTLYGATTNGGDGYAKGSEPDTKVGVGPTFSIQRARCVWTPSGWQVQYVLGAAPSDLRAVIVPRGVLGRQIKL